MKAFAFAVAIAALLPLAARADEQKPASGNVALSASTGIDYSRGRYGTDAHTDIFVSLVGLTLQTGDLRLTLNQPYLRIEGPASVVLDGKSVVINPKAGTGRSERDGFGDLSLGANYDIPAEDLDGFDLNVGGTFKLPTASTKRSLGTGESDFSVSADLSYDFDSVSPFVTMGYRMPGDPTGYTLRNTVLASLGADMPLGDSMLALLAYEYEGAASPLLVSSQDMFASLSWLASDSITVTAYGVAGLSSGSPDTEAGLLLNFKLD